MRSERFDFPGATGASLAARLDLPDTPPAACAVFAHCFTCGKDVKAAARIAQALTRLGIAVLRFDFTGIGSSEGEFANTDFSSNVEDLLAAAAHLQSRGYSADILIGHSLGGAAVLVAADSLPGVKAVATIAAPADPAHIAHLLKDRLEAIAADGEAELELGGQTFRVRKRFLDDLQAQRQTERIARLRRALLIMHSPVDNVVGIDNATEIFTAAKHPKSFVSLDMMDHLLGGEGEAAYVAGVIAAWAARYVDAPITEASEERRPADLITVEETGYGKFQQAVAMGRHRLLADEPRAYGGNDSGGSPYDLLLAGLGACTSMTIRMYADRKQWPLETVRVDLKHRKVHAEDCADCATKDGKIDRISRAITLTGDLDSDQRAKLIEISEKCPVHRTLHSKVMIETEEQKQ